MTKEEILSEHGEHADVGYRKHVLVAMDDFAKQQSIAFAEWLSENTETIKEEKITLYRYRDSDGFANYILEDIYLVFIENQ